MAQSSLVWGAFRRSLALRTTCIERSIAKPQYRAFFRNATLNAKAAPASRHSAPPRGKTSPVRNNTPPPLTRGPGSTSSALSPFLNSAADHAPLTLLYQSASRTSFLLFSYISGGLFIIGAVNTAWFSSHDAAAATNLADGHLVAAAAVNADSPPQSGETDGAVATAGVVSSQGVPWYIRAPLIFSAIALTVVGTVFILAPTKSVSRIWLVSNKRSVTKGHGTPTSKALETPSTTQPPSELVQIRIETHPSIPYLQRPKLHTVSPEAITRTGPGRSKPFIWGVEFWASPELTSVHSVPYAQNDPITPSSPRFANSPLQVALQAKLAALTADAKAKGIKLGSSYDVADPPPERTLAQRVQGLVMGLATNTRKMFVRDGFAKLKVEGLGTFKVDLNESMMLNKLGGLEFGYVKEAESGGGFGWLDRLKLYLS